MAGFDNVGLEISDEMTSGVTDMHETLPRISEQFGDGPMKNEIKSDMSSSMESANTLTTTLCGWLCFKPSYLQRFRTAKWALFWLCWAGAMQGMIVNGFINVVITTIEKRFGLTSSETGLIAGGYDIASFLLLIPVSYLGGRSQASKPKYVGVGVIVLGIGSLLFASPHYLAGPYRGGNQQENVCQRMSSNGSLLSSNNECDTGGIETTEIEPNRGFYLMIFLFAQLLHGAGAAPFYTLGVTYLDENVSKKMSSVYLGIYYTMAVIGPAMGYVIGGELLKLYTDFLTVDPGSIGMTSNNNVWIGAWWIGFVGAAIICFIVAIPILAFPASLPGAVELAKEKVSEAHEKSTASSQPPAEALSKIRQLPRAFTELLSNPAFFLLNLAGASEGLLIAGFASFLPKLIENQFSVSASSAAVLMGLVTVPAGGGGTFLGGYLIKRWNLPCTGILKFCIFVTAACIIFTFAFALSCPNLNFAGVTVAYNNVAGNALSLSSECNSDCSCSRLEFNPICGVDQVTYYSPCHAGCNQEIQMNDVKVYQNCSCIHGTMGSLTTSMHNETIYYDAINTKCNSTCGYLWFFVALAFGMMLMTFLCTMPALAATLRVIRDDQRSFALGIQWIKVRILGTIPAPMIFGALIDDTCILWHESCERRGACLVYDNYYMSLYMLALGLIGKTASLIFFFLAWWWYVPPGGRRITPDNGQQPVATIMHCEGPNNNLSMHNSTNPMAVS